MKRILSKHEPAQPLCGIRSDAACMLVFDGTENPVGLLTNSASVAFTYKYDPWGVQTLTSGGTGNGATQNPYAFHGGIKDPSSGLVKFGLRWYNPTTGTWTQQDTLDAPLDPANANRYAYAGDDPINNLDPTGLYDLGAAAGTVANFSGAGAGAGATIGCIVGLYAAVVGCPLGGVEAGAVIGTVAGFIFGLGYAVGQSEAGVYG